MPIRKELSKSIYVLLVVLLIAAVSASCIRIVKQNETGPSQQPLTNPGPSTQSGGQTRPHPPVRTGEITLGQKVDVASQSIGTEGGILSMLKPGDPLDGFVLAVPPGSYPANRTFKVSYAPITKQTFGNDFNPITPMIMVDNGGGYADELINITIPVKVPDGYFAMGFLYDDKTKQLEGMPLITQDADSITVGTRHFSNFLISMISKSMLKDDIDSGFQPGIDDWQFANRGSYIAPGGQCEGQSLAAMWYYCTQPDGKDLCLYARYDNNGNKPETPGLWVDDSLGYRFCSTVHSDIDLGAFAYKFWDNLSGVVYKSRGRDIVPGISDETQRNLFAFSMQLTGEPQQVGIISLSGVGGHVMICYRINKGTLYVADPNYPGNTERRIVYANNKFEPYNSGANKADIDAGKGMKFERILYTAKTTIIPWDTIAKRWTEFKNGTIGNDKFPQWKLLVADSKGSTIELIDGLVVTEQLLAVGAAQLPNQAITYGAYIDGTLVQAIDGKIPLKPGNNVIGFVIWGEKNNVWKYIDFKYINVIYKAEEPLPSNARVKVTLIITQVSPECSFGLNNIYDAAGKKMVVVPVDLKPGSWKYAAELLPGNYIVKYSCRCSPRGQKDYTPEKEFPLTVSKDPITLNLPCPP
jgi:hypothetical protein